MAQYAQIIIDISHEKLDRPFTYRVPESLTGVLRTGSRVLIPFGAGGRLRTGYVIGFTDTCSVPPEKVKDVQEALEQGTDRTGQNAIALAAWMKERYGSTLITALKTVLPARKNARPAKVREVALKLSPDEARQKLAFYHNKHQVARERLIASLLQTPSQPYSLITEKLHVNAATLRALKDQGILDISSRTLLRNPVCVPDEGVDRLALSPEQQGIVRGVLADFDRLQRGKTGPSEVSRDPYGKTAGQPPAEPECDPGRVSLLHGITGSGKTEVYISIIEQIVARGRQAIMLIPEISLTYQTLLRFYRHFGDRVSVMNSTLSESEKADQSERARRGDIDVIIGPRSALFTPFPHIGVIVIDEEHENSYKNEQMPKYHAREAAVQIARMQDAVVVLGSATPSLESYYQAQLGHYRLYTLKRRLTGGTLPEVEIADLRQELRAGNRSILSGRLKELLTDRLEKGEQSMLFLNRRGTSGFVSCRSCGHVMKCPHCDVALSLHRGGRLMCHYCGYEEPMPERCPECGSPYISGFRAGTEAIENGIRKMFPKARVLRMDADTTAKKGGYEKILSAFANEEADILIGTQMIVKGHDFPNVTLVGILLADLSLYSNDYRAAERTFQLLTQAAGRAGRGDRKGSVVIQTYEPEHYAVEHASHQDYEGFYREEIQYRSLLQYPPVCHMLAVQITSRSDDHAQAEAGILRGLLGKITGETAGQPAGAASSGGGKIASAHGVILIGPAAASIGKLRDTYRYVIYIKCAKYDILVDCKDRCEALLDWQKAQPGAEAGSVSDVYVDFDFDPVNPF